MICSYKWHSAAFRAAGRLQRICRKTLQKVALASTKTPQFFQDRFQPLLAPRIRWFCCFERSKTQKLESDPVLWAECVVAGGRVVGGASRPQLPQYANSLVQGGMHTVTTPWAPSIVPCRQGQCIRRRARGVCFQSLGHSKPSPTATAQESLCHSTSNWRVPRSAATTRGVSLPGCRSMRWRARCIAVVVARARTVRCLRRLSRLASGTVILKLVQRATFAVKCDD